MPINQLEQHPYLKYERNHNREYIGLIVGSFPIYACTNLIDQNLNNLIEINQDNLIRFRFFYGSNKSKFWDYIFKAFNNNDEITKSNCIKFLEDNRIIITDSLFRTNRKKQSSLDIDLMISDNTSDFVVQNLSLNYSIKELIEENPNLKNLYFTAIGLDGKSPFGWFRRIFEDDLKVKEIFEVQGRTWSFTCVIKDREFNVFMLPTPKPRGIHFTNNQRTIAFCNYLQSVDMVFYNEINNLSMVNRTKNQKKLLSEYRNEFLIETYRQAILYNNIKFNGALEL